MTADEVNKHLQNAEKDMKDSLEHLRGELLHVRTGKASPSMVDNVMVSYYGSMTPLNQVANVGTTDARTLTIQPWEKTMIEPIEKAIFEANIGLTPQNDGELIRINVPPLTQERRKEMVKRIKSMGEDAKVSIRSARHKAMDHVKKAVKEGFPEDNGKRKEEEIQNMTDKHIKDVDKIVEAKEKDIMTV